MTSHAHRHSAALNIKSTWSQVLWCWAELGWERNNGIWSNLGPSPSTHTAVQTQLWQL